VTLDPVREIPRLHIHTNTYFQDIHAITVESADIPTLCSAMLSQNAGKWSFFIHLLTERLGRSRQSDRRPCLSPVLSG
jgi:hypothetical protein